MESLSDLELKHWRINKKQLMILECFSDIEGKKVTEAVRSILDEYFKGLDNDLKVLLKAKVKERFGYDLFI